VKGRGGRGIRKGTNGKERGQVPRRKREVRKMYRKSWLVVVVFYFVGFLVCVFVCASFGIFYFS